MRRVRPERTAAAEAEVPQPAGGRRGGEAAEGDATGVFAAGAGFADRPRGEDLDPAVVGRSAPGAVRRSAYRSKRTVANDLEDTSPSSVRPGPALVDGR